MSWKALIILITLAVPAASQSRPVRLPAPSFEQLSREAEKAFNENRDNDAIRLYKQALKIKPDWDEGLWYLGVLSYQSERFAESRDVLRHFVAQNPGHAPAWAVLGLSEYKTREYPRALRHLDRALSLGLSERKDLATSVYYYKAALLIRSEQFQDGLVIATRLTQMGQPQDRLETLAGLAALEFALLPEEMPPDRRELVNMAGAGTLALLAQRRDEAEKYFKKMVEEYPNEPRVHYQYGVLLLGDRNSEGIVQMQKELTISPSSILPRLRLAEYYASQSHPEQARPYLDETLKIDPQNATGHVLMGEVLAKLGESDAAIRELELAKTLSPERGRVLWALMRLYTAAGRTDDANRVKAEIAKLKEAEPDK